MVALKSMDQYGPQFQTKVISALLNHKSFLINIHDILSDEYFSGSSNKWIVKEIVKYFEKYHTNLSMDVLKVELQKVNNEVLQIAIKEQLKSAYSSSDEDLEYVTEEFSSFCKNQQLGKALLKSVDLLNSGEYDSIRTLVDNALKAGQDKNVGHEYKKDIEDRYRENHRVVVPTPWPEINSLLQGGLGNGDYGMLFGNPGGGKSWLMVALGGFATKLGYNPIHYTLELGESYVGLRYDAYHTKIPVDTIREHKDKVEEVVPNLKGELIITELISGKATVTTIEAHIGKMKDLGFKPDLIIVDYADLMTTTKRTVDRKAEIDYINLKLKGMAKELDLPVWSVSQVNREGSKENVIEGNKAAGSYDKTMITDFSMSLSRKRKDKVNGTGRFHIMKNRYGPDGMTYNAKIDTSIGYFEFLSEYDEEDDEEQLISKPLNTFNNVDNFDKQELRSRFFELNPKE